MDNNGKGVWKSTALFLAGVILALSGTWATYVRGAVSRDEMEKYVNERTSKIEERLRSLDEHVLELKQDTASIKGRFEQADRERAAAILKRQQ